MGAVSLVGAGWVFSFFFIRLGEAFSQPCRFGLSPRSRPAALPLRRVFVSCHLRDGLAAEHRGRVLLDIVTGHDRLVVLLDHEPFGALAARTPRFHVNEREVSGEAFSM